MKMTSKSQWPLSRRTLLVGAAAGASAAMLDGCVLADPGAEIPDSGSPPFDADAGLDAGADAGTDAGIDGGADGGLDGGPTPQCDETEDNILGPYYRPDAPFRTVFASPNDGEWLVISGIASGLGGGNGGPRCETLEGMLIDVWAANGAADYDMTDPGFLWRGRLNAQANGAYAFETVLPGRYLNGNQYRPRHLHLKASHPGYVPLTTQIYFEGDPFLAADPFARASLVIPLSKINGVWRGTFPIVLAPA